MARVYKALIHEKHRWRKVDTLLKETDFIRDRVSEALSRLENDGLARKAYFQSVDNKDLWGATSVVGRSPRPL